MNNPQATETNEDANASMYEEGTEEHTIAGVLEEVTQAIEALPNHLNLLSTKNNKPIVNELPSPATANEPTSPPTICEPSSLHIDNKPPSSLTPVKEELEDYPIRAFSPPSLEKYRPELNSDTDYTDAWKIDIPVAPTCQQKDELPAPSTRSHYDFSLSPSSSRESHPSMEVSNSISL